MDEFTEIIEDGHIPSPYLAAQHTLSRFAEVGYQAALLAYQQHGAGNGVGYQKQQILDLLATNPPLISIPSYYAEGREDYLWYSDFYDDTTKECFAQYGRFVPSPVEITPANYAQELTKVDLPYFQELVRLVCLLRVVDYIESRQLKSTAPKPAIADTPEKVDAEYDKALKIEATAKRLPKSATKLRSYEPCMTTGQYALLAKCLNRFEVLRSNVNATTLRELFEGKKSHPLQITNQRTLTYIFDALAQKKLIRKAWIAVAAHNENFASGPRRGVEQKKDAGLHYVTKQQFANNRLANQYKYVEHMDDIDESIEDIAGE